MTIFSGIQPSGVLHLGNYLGALKQFIALQNEGQALYCIVDLHAITVPQKPSELRENTLNLAAMYLAAGLDPKNAILFVQSHVAEHAELAWILNTIATMGELERMTQYKEKTTSHKPQAHSSINVGLFGYPVLMAADILLYQTDVVPVGEDQKQHVELCRDIAKRFNNRFGQTFTIPEVRLQKEGARIMGLDDPTKKMSKSASSPNNYIALTDDAQAIKKKVARAVTDSGSEVRAGSDKPALTNLLTIMSLLSETSIQELEKHYAGKGYAEFKRDLAQTLIEHLEPLQEHYTALRRDETKLLTILHEGADRARAIARKTMEKVRERVGFTLAPPPLHRFAEILPR